MRKKKRGLAKFVCCCCCCFNPTMHTKLWDGPKHWFKTREGLTWCSWESVSFHFGGNPVALTSFVHSNMRVSGYSSPLIPQAPVLTQREGGRGWTSPTWTRRPEWKCSPKSCRQDPTPLPSSSSSSSSSTRNRRYLPVDRSSGQQAGCLSGRIFLGRRSEQVPHPVTHHSWCWSSCGWSVAAGLRRGLYHYRHRRRGGGVSPAVTCRFRRLIRFSPCDE